MKKKVKIVSILMSICAFTTLPLLINNKDWIYLSLNNFSTKANNENIYPIAKVDSLYEVQTLRKITSDKDAINVVFVGDNYAKDANKNLFSDYCYKNIVIPWLSTTYPGWSEDITFLNSGTKTPFQTFLNNKINIYSVQPNLKENNIIYNSTDTFLGIFTSNTSTTNMLDISKAGKIKSSVLTYDITKNFLEEDAIVTPSYLGLIRNGGFGRANAPAYYLATTEDHTNTHIHEMGHSIWGLADEYDEHMTKGVNRAHLVNPTENNIPWKEFLDFRGIDIVSTSSSNTITNEWIPSISCVMNFHSNIETSDFCEVCLHQIIKRGVQITQNEYFYIADPQLTPSEGRVNYNDQSYNTNYLESLELYDFNIDNANNKHLDFRTVVDNMTLAPRNIKLRVSISGTGGFVEESDSFNIQPGEIKQLKFITLSQVGELKYNSNTIIGEVIDADTNEVLATSYDRYNNFFRKQQFLTEPDFNFGKNIYSVTINFLDKATNQPLPNIKPSTLIKRDGETFQLEKIIFNGYHLDEAKSKINNSNITINGQNLTFNYYYDALPSKSLKLKLVDDSNNVIQEKVVKVYEGQKFIPKTSDFFLYNLETFVGSSNENSKWLKSIAPPRTTYTYSQIQDNQTELVYKISQEKPYYIFSKEIKLIQGEQLSTVLYDSLYSKYLSSAYNYDFTSFVFDPNIIYNSVDTSTPGEYLVVFYIKNSDDIKSSNYSLFKLNVVVEPNKNPGFISNNVENEKIRLQNYGYIWIDQLEEEKGFMSDFEAINQNNLLDNINNFNLNYDKYDYEVLEFKKLYPNVDSEIFLGYKFKIQITDKTSRASTVTNYFTKYIWLNEDAPITPPTEEVEMQNEIDRINSLSLSLKNPILTQEEVNNINQNNILENVNGWIETSGFAYEVINFNNSSNQFKFNIKVSKENAITIKTSNLFTLSYQIKSEQTEEDLLNQEINRINNLSLLLTKNDFTQEEINLISETNFINYLSNWSSVILDSSKYNYEIINLNTTNNKFTFNIKVTLKSDLSISQTSKQFSLDYQITANINQALEEEKNRIDQLDLSFNKQEFSQDEINGILSNPSSIVDYLNNWEPNNQFDYQFDVNLLPNNQLGLTIQIKDKNTSEYQSSKSFVLFYEQSNIPNNNNSDNSNNLTTIILASTLTPAGAIAAGTAGTIIYKKKRRRY